MLHCEKISLANVKDMAGCYKRFQGIASSDYRWDMAAIGFDGFQIAIGQQILEGYLIRQTAGQSAASNVVGFALYKIEPHQAIEINVIHIEEGVSKKAALDKLMRTMITDWLQQPAWEVVSFAMLGKQQELIYSITWYGFRPVGQTIVRLNLVDPVTAHVLKKQKEAPTLPEGYSLGRWDASRREEVAQVVVDAFKDKSDALWDPRFRQLEGGREVVRFITGGDMGQHLEQCTSLLYNEVAGEKRVVGFCFLVQTDLGIANIPIIGLVPSERGKGFGVELMRHMLFQTVDAIVAGTVGLTEINATLDTDNYAAIKMYRRFGYQEDDNYPHSYLPRELAEKIQAGDWCQVPPFEEETTGQRSAQEPTVAVLPANAQSFPESEEN